MKKVAETLSSLIEILVLLIFTEELIRRVIFALCVGTAFIGTNAANAFHYQKIGLKETIIYRNGFATTGTPMSTTDNQTLYYNSMTSLAYVEMCYEDQISLGIRKCKQLKFSFHGVYAADNYNLFFHVNDL